MTRSIEIEDTLAVASTVHAIGQPAAAPDDEARQLGAVPATTRYVPLGLLGQGGMGRVEHVWDADLMRHLAIKRLRPDLKADAALVQQFLWEARVSAYLDHPSIAPVHDLGVSDGHLYFTMPRVSGLSLDTIVSRLREGDQATLERMPLQRRLRIFLQIVHAVAFAHGRGVLHRDLKPANVMLGEHGEVRVMDWGLAMPLPGPVGEPLRVMMPAGLERLSSSAGTPRYMSPEQARGEPLDHRSDVYALGAILYELAALVPPVEGATLSEVLDKLKRGETRPLQVAWPAAPSSLRAIVERAMAFEPALRYSSCADMAEDIEALIDGGTPKAESASPLTRAARFYLGHDPAMGRLRVWEIDFLAGASFFFGGAAAAGLARFVAAWWPALLVAGIGLAMPPTIHWLRLKFSRRRPSANTREP